MPDFLVASDGFTSFCDPPRTWIFYKKLHWRNTHSYLRVIQTSLYWNEIRDNNELRRPMKVRQSSDPCIKSEANRKVCLLSLSAAMNPKNSILCNCHRGVRSRTLRHLWKMTVIPDSVQQVKYVIALLLTSGGFRGAEKRQPPHFQTRERQPPSRPMAECGRYATICLPPFNQPPLLKILDPPLLLTCPFCTRRHVRIQWSKLCNSNILN